MATTYIPPQVIVQGERAMGGTQEYIQPSTICIIGRIDRYPSKIINRILANGYTITIDEKNIIEDSITLTTVDGTKLVKDTDYTQAVNADENNLSITVINKDLKTQSISINYQYLPDAFFDPLKWFTKASIENYYGAPYNDDHTVASSIVASAEMTLDNGATSVCILPVKDPVTGSKNPSQTLEQALQKIQQMDDIAIIVPAALTKDDLLVIKNHISWCNTHAHERRGIFAIDGTTTTFSVDALCDISRSLDDEFILFIPNTIAPVYVSDSRNTINLPGWLWAAALAGVAIQTPVQNALTRQNLTGFYGVQDWLYEEKNTLAQAGCCVIEMVNGVIRVRHSVVTFQDQQLDWCYSGVYIYIMRAMRALFDPYIGKPSSDVMVTSIASECQLYLIQAQETGLIYGFSDLEVARRNRRPDIIDVTFHYRWLAPINWIYVNFSVDTTY